MPSFLANTKKITAAQLQAEHGANHPPPGLIKGNSQIPPSPQDWREAIEMVPRVKCLPCLSHGLSASPDEGRENQLVKLSFDLHMDVTHDNSKHNFKSSLCNRKILKRKGKKEKD